MTQGKKISITVIASFLGAFVTIATIAWAIGKPHFDKEVKRVFTDQLNGPEVEVFFQAKSKIKEDEYKARIKESSEKSFRVLCGEKLGVPFDESHIEIGNLKKRIEELEKQQIELKNCCNLRGRNQMIRI